MREFKNIRTFAQLAFRIFVRPIFPLGQWLVIRLGIVKGPKSTGYSLRERQPFLLGVLKEGVTPESARKQLILRGFFMNRVAYTDPGQVLSMRRLDELESDMQYHLRVFVDGEVRGHYEYTPEDKPIRHLRDVIFEKREHEFALWLTDILR